MGIVKFGIFSNEHTQLPKSWDKVVEVVSYRIMSVGLTRGGNKRIAWELGLLFLLPVLPGSSPGRAKIWPIPAD